MSEEGSLGVLSALLNRSISQSETARAELAGLGGQCLRVEVEGIGIAVHFVALDDRLLLTLDTDIPPHATISGLPLSLVRLLGERAPDATTLRTLGVRLDGDQAVAADFAKLLRRARPDLEEELSLVMGDIAAHQVGSALRALQGFGERTLDTLRQNTSEFLVEESRMVPNQLQARAFCNEVDQVRDAVERAAARLARLEQREKAGGP